MAAIRDRKIKMYDLLITGLMAFRAAQFTVEYSAAYSKHKISTIISAWFSTGSFHLAWRSFEPGVPTVVVKLDSCARSVVERQ